MTQPADPKLFISYSWSSPDHEAWVLRLAGDLTSQGVHVVLDKWDLQPGHDANAFMETMVTDPTVTKVVLVCDRKYMEKSNARSGGAGTEAQIITPSLYAKRDQDKFVAIICERDDEGHPFIPAYYGSRIYIDLTDPTTYSAEFDRLLRWIWDQPLHIRPARGEKPGFLTQGDTAPKIASSVEFRRAFEAIRGGAPNAVGLVKDYFTALARGLEQFRVEIADEQRELVDDLIVKAIEEFLPYKTECIEIFSAIAQFDSGEAMINAVHRFFETLLPFTDRPRDQNAWHDVDFDQFRFIVHELFLYCVAVLIRAERFDSAAQLLNTEYFWEKPSRGEDNMHAFTIFGATLRVLQHRNQRLKLNRTSVHADMLFERNKGTGIDFRYLAVADFVLFLRSRQLGDYWWPETLLYADRYGGAFEMFARAKSAVYFKRIARLLGVEKKSELEDLVVRLNQDSRNLPRWNYMALDLNRRLNLEAIATSP